MSEESKELVDYEALLAGMAKNATAVEKPSSNTIGTRSGILTYGGQPCPGNKLDVIVVGAVHQNLYYVNKFDQDNPTNPDCYAYSPDPDVVPLKPHASCKTPQAESCEACPYNKWGSDPEGGRGKACKNSRHLALVPAGVKAEDVPSAEIATLKLPVTSGANWSNYVHKLAALFNRPPLGMITTIGTEPNIKHQYHVTFLDKGPVDRELLKPLIDLASSEKVRKILEREYEPNPEPSEQKPKKERKF